MASWTPSLAAAPLADKSEDHAEQDRSDKRDGDDCQQEQEAEGEHGELEELNDPPPASMPVAVAAHDSIITGYTAGRI